MNIIIHLRPTVNFKRCMRCGKVFDDNDKYYFKSKQLAKSPFKCQGIVKE